jgi:hypothetical protein
MIRWRLGAFLLCGFLAASRAQGEPVAYETLDDRSKIAIAEGCDSWVLRESADLVAFWMAAIEPLCAAATSTQPGAGQPPVAPAQAQ